MTAYIFQGLDGWPQVALVVVVASLFLAGMAWLIKKVDDETYGLGAWIVTVPPSVHTDTMTEEEEPSVLISAKTLRILVDDAADAPPKKGIDQEGAAEEAESALESTMPESYELVVIDLPDSSGQVYVRTWDSGQVDVDYRPTHSAGWRPIVMVGGSFRLEPSE